MNKRWPTGAVLIPWAMLVLLLAALLASCATRTPAEQLTAGYIALDQANEQIVRRLEAATSRYEAARGITERNMLRAELERQKRVRSATKEAQDMLDLADASISAGQGADGVVYLNLADAILAELEEMSYDR